MAKLLIVDDEKNIRLSHRRIWRHFVEPLVAGRDPVIDLDRQVAD